MRITHSTVIIVAMLTPLSVLALNFSQNTVPRYWDVTPGTPDAKAIGLLTSEGVVSGFADGSFKPTKLLNRAEFSKFAFLSSSGSLTVVNAPCFADTPAGAWYTGYVCALKRAGAVDGNEPKVRGGPRLFSAGVPVNYAEAVKILSVLSGYQITPMAGEVWYDAYMREATHRGTALTAGASPSKRITRAQAARLIAAFLAESQGQLAAYRAYERGQVVTTSSVSSVAGSLRSASLSSSRRSSSSSSSSSSWVPFWVSSSSSSSSSSSRSSSLFNTQSSSSSSSSSMSPSS